MLEFDSKGKKKVTKKNNCLTGCRTHPHTQEAEERILGEVPVWMVG